MNKQEALRKIEDADELQGLQNAVASVQAVIQADKQLWAKIRVGISAQAREAEEAKQKAALEAKRKEIEAKKAAAAREAAAGP